MDLDIYWIMLLVLLPTVVLLTGRGLFIRAYGHVHTRWRRVRHWDAAHKAQGEPGKDASPPPPTTPSKPQEATRFRTNFLSVYLLVMSSEWLSGPYLYPLLRDDKALPISVVVALYATAYTSAAVSALGVGFLADRYGRRRACLAECVVHALACLSVVLGGDSLPVLFLGRVLAGVGLTLLWTVFESWVVTEWNARGLEGRQADGGGGELGRMFGMMTMANCMTAIVGGVLGHCMVSFVGSKLWPFGAGVVLEAVAAVLMLRNWNENYGVQMDAIDNEDSPVTDVTGRGRLGDGRIWALTFVTCCFEGTGFLVVFFWPSVLQDAHDHQAHPAGTSDDNDGGNGLPYGVIFASFMASMILGALLFSALSRPGVLSKHRVVVVVDIEDGKSNKEVFVSSMQQQEQEQKQQQENPAWAPVCLLLGAVAVAAASLSVLAAGSDEATRFYAFLVFEAANGVYVPSVAYLRGLVVGERSRTGLYGLMKIPLFVFVILALGITAEDTQSRGFIFATASFCLLLAGAAMALGFLETLRPAAAASRSREETTTTTSTSSRRRDLSLDSCCSGSGRSDGSDLEEEGEGVGVRKPDVVVGGCYGRGDPASASAQVDEEKVAFLGRPGQQQTL